MIHAAANEHVWVITLARPEKRNALTPDALRALAQALREAPASTHTVLLQGEGRAFCAGFDLSLCKDDPPHQPTLGALLTHLAAAVRAMRDQPRPVVLCAHGAAIAGGCALLGGADLVVADRAAKLGYPVVRLGVSPAVSAPWLRLAVGDGQARSRTLDTQLITGERAHELGLVHELTETPDDARPRALELARSLAAKPPHAVAATRGWLDRIGASPAAGDAERALAASMSLVGHDESRTMLAEVWR